VCAWTPLEKHLKTTENRASLCVDNSAERVTDGDINLDRENHVNVERLGPIERFDRKESECVYVDKAQERSRRRDNGTERIIYPLRVERPHPYKDTY